MRFKIATPTGKKLKKMVRDLDNTFRHKAKERLQRAGEEGRMETVYERSSGNIIEAHSSIVIIQEHSNPTQRPFHKLN